MNLIWFLKGWVRLRLTSADPASRLREFAGQGNLEQIEYLDDLTVEFRIAASDGAKLRISDGERLEKIDAGGLPVFLRWLWSWRMVAATVVILGALTALIPTRVWFLEVRGEGVPTALVLERAAECGVYFGAPRREIRSEQVKNHLLWAIPELRWAGVNTDGCRAVITVSCRDPGETEPDERPGDIVAAVDGVVTEVTLEAGTARVKPGQAVQMGETLISGTTDLGHSIRVEQASGEVYGLTRRIYGLRLPAETRLRGENSRVVRKFSLRIGKKYVNFSNDSGILYGTCVKMRTVKYLTLPGGYKLPVALVTDTYLLAEIQTVSREMDGEALLREARRYARQQMTAGTILSERLLFEDAAPTVVFECRELLGVFRPGITSEGDTNDRENRERGAG